MSDLKIYVVTLKYFDDLQQFYEDMETEGGALYIPNRAVEVAHRRSISKSTHYYLTDEEAQLIRNDPRVASVELQADQRGVEIKSCYVEFSELWDKSDSPDPDPAKGIAKNWGLLRSYLGTQIADWGSNNIAAASGTIEVLHSGRNVDVVVVDGLIDPTLSEFQKNPDGTGGTRVQQINWMQYYSYTNYTGNYNYTLTPEQSWNNNHGAAVASIIAGNSQGWARDANIYNISPYDGQVFADYLFDIIRLWHRTKPINPETGFRNPTIVNCSFGYFFWKNISVFDELNFRGSSYYSPFNADQLLQFGLRQSAPSTYPGWYQLPVNISYVNDDLELAIGDGIVVVGAAGNEYLKVTTDFNDPDLNNVLATDGYNSYFYYNQGGSPRADYTGALWSPITSRDMESTEVGAIDSLDVEVKADFSNTGERVNIFAPGVNIMAAINTNWVNPDIPDPRGVGFLTKTYGTSFASPQVAGVLACLAERYPDLNQGMANQYLNKYATYNQISDPPPNELSNDRNLQGGSNKYLKFKNEPIKQTVMYPFPEWWIRPEVGITWPRAKVPAPGRST